MQENDSKAFDEVIKSRQVWLDKPMVLLTQYGREVIWPVVILLIAIFGGWEGRKTALVIVIAVLVLIPLSIIIKDLVARARPDISLNMQLSLPAERDRSYPSGHSIIVAAGAAIMLALFRTNKRIIVSVAMTMEASAGMYFASIRRSAFSPRCHWRNLAWRGSIIYFSGSVRSN